MRYTVWAAATLLLASGVVACSGDPSGPDDTGGGQDVTSADGFDASLADHADTSPSTDGGPDGCEPCGATCCARGQRCAHDTCIPDLGRCTSNDDCPGDSYCDTDMRCVPYGVPADRVSDPECRRLAPLEGITPTVQCEWTGEEPGGLPTPYALMYSSPFVADLNLDHDPARVDPSIVGVTFGTIAGVRRGMLRVFSGRTCAEQMNIGEPEGPDADDAEPAYGMQVAIGDIDGDLVESGGTLAGHPEIIAYHRTPGAGNTPLELIAYRVLESPHRLARAWIGRQCDVAGEPPFRFGTSADVGGPSLLDLDDDGRPEILVDRYVFDANGCVLNPAQPYESYDNLGVFTVAADVDNDGEPELARHDGVYAWDRVARDWRLEPYWRPAMGSTFPAGNVAIADMGAYPTPKGVPAATAVPEIIVVSAQSLPGSPSGGSVWVQTITGQIVFGPLPVYSTSTAPAGRGGAPTAADFDGDGQPEFATAGASFYVVFDPDCVGGGDPARRPGGRCVRGADPLPDGVLWARPSQDLSSNVTGSSVFDFDGDGTAEAVYRDECYLRVYRGATGEVIFSAPASSGTGYEMPVIADVDGDFATEIVVPRANNISSCPATDPLLPGPRWSNANGFVILRDPDDRWAASRPVWNQHAYSVTHVTDEARIPRTRDVARNWAVPGLNNFRQNSQGALGRLNIADLTVSLARAVDLCETTSTTVPLAARVCNRGTNPVADGALVRFQLPDSSGGAPRVLCEVSTTRVLRPGECVEVSCTGRVDDPARVRQIEVIVDPQGAIADCHTGNNRGAVPQVYCPPG